MVAMNWITYHCGTAVIIICVSILSTEGGVRGASSSLPDALNRTRRQAYDCSFRCASGSCVDVDRVCDGARDCDDGSDETRSQCSTNPACPGLSYRCDYGACVDADARCNGINDCADGSDEHPRVCNPGHNKNPNKPGNNRPPSTGTGIGLSNNRPASDGCRSEEHRCANGQCVDNTVVCDGRKDCADGSDETYTQCYSVKCPSYSFRCSYGGCIDREARCDGVRHCADGSDEDGCSGSAGAGSGAGQRPSQTQRPTQTQRPSQTQRPAQTQRPRPSQTTARPSSGSDGQQCRLPARVSGGFYRVEDCQSGDTSAICRTVPNTPVPHSTVLSYQCDPGYSLSSDNNFTFCLKGVWTPEPPTCAKICPALISTSVDIECSLHGKQVRCDKGQLPGTRAKLKCKPSYRFPAGVAAPDYDAVNCKSDGTWDWPLFKCIADLRGILFLFTEDGLNSILPVAVLPVDSSDDWRRLALQLSHVWPSHNSKPNLEIARG